MASTLPLMAQEESESTYEPLAFIENKGQWDGDFLFKSDLGTAFIYLKKNGFRFYLLNGEDQDRLAEYYHGHSHRPEQNPSAHNPRPGHTPSLPDAKLKPPPSRPVTPPKVRGHAYDLVFIGSAENPEIIPEKPVGAPTSYFLGNDRSKWRSDIQPHTRITYKSFYDNIDMQVYSENSQLKYDLIVMPGGDPGKIAFSYTGASAVTLRKGNLYIQTTVGETVELMPFAYQYINNQRKSVNVQYQLKGTTVSFKVSGRYDPKYPLVIDPTVVFATLTGSRADNWGFTATYDAAGNFYAGGIVFGVGYPTTTGAFDNSYHGGYCDMSISKFNALGSRLLYSTYIGGSGNDQPHSLIVDGAGNLVIAGKTDSGDYPTTSPNHGATGGFDIAVTKLNATGTGLIGSMKIGGSGDDGYNMRSDKGSGADKTLRNYGDDARSEVILDDNGNIYIAGSSRSTDGTLATAGVFQTENKGNQDGIIVKVRPNVDAVIWASFIGGRDADAAFVLALNGADGVYVAGGTASNDFPVRGSVIYPGYRGGACDGFIARVNATGTALQLSTFIGSDDGSADQVYGIQRDNVGNIYVMGTTEGRWPIRRITGVTPFYEDVNAKQFISKLDANLSNFIYSTTFGKNASTPSISPVAFLVDRCQNVYVSGWGGAINVGYPNSDTRGLPVTNDARKRVSDGSDFYFFVMQRDATGLLYGSYFGANGLAEHVDGGTSRFDRNGVIYQAICASCAKIPKPRFPTTPGAYYSGTPEDCNLAALKIAFNLDGVRAGFTTLERRRNYCYPETITFIDTTNSPAQSWSWNFGDGSPEERGDLDTVTHTFNRIGDYTVRLIKYDQTSCNGTDTAYVPIRIRADRATLGFTPNRLQPCTEMNYEFINNSVPPPNKPFQNNSFVWDFGDGTPPDTTGPGNMTHTYLSEGVYNVTLALIDTNYCNAPEVLTVQLRVASQLRARFLVPDSACVPFTAVFDNISSGGMTFEWDFGDGHTSTDIYPEHTYETDGQFTVTLTAHDPNTCNTTDDTSMVITVLPLPTAAFSYMPDKPIENTPHDFTNESTGASHYWWDFGDGDTSTAVNPSHQYLRTGTYNVCLIAVSEFGCEDTVCHQVSAIVNPLFDVPSAFSPNGDGINDTWMIKGFGIIKFELKIFNRWGRLMFQSTDPKQGWDGRFKGALQPMDAYAYTVRIEFSDGTQATKNGNVTLLR